MTKLTLDISMSLDGFVAGPNRTMEQPLGEGGEQLHEWVVAVASWREAHGHPGGTTGPDDDVLKESVEAAGAIVMGRRMFSGGEGPWEDDPVADGWWGDDPPFGVPVFVITHHPREPETKGDTRSSPTGPRRHSRGLEQPRARRTSRSRAERASRSSICGRA